MAFGRKVTTYLADGVASGIRHVEIANWSGQALACPRSRLGELKNWDEVQRPGVYFLLEKQSGEIGDKVYIGESENVLKRLAKQAKDQDFWNEVVIFTSKDENLTKAHIKYLESRITVMAVAADRYLVSNANTPTQSMLPRADRDTMEEFIHSLRIVIGTLGHRVLEPIVEARTEIVRSFGESLADFEFSFSITGKSAQGRQTDDGFVILLGSDIALHNTSSMPANMVELRDKWIIDKVVEQIGNKLRLKKDVVISSSSYAASLVAGTRRSGPQSWKTENGVTLKDTEQSLLEKN